jgi:hypothetical protein
MMLRTVRFVILALGVIELCSVNAFAFHDAGVAYCGGCHTMHNSQNGELVDADSPNGNPWLLKDATPSDVCLNCHATSYGGVFADPAGGSFREQGGGNFWYLLEDNLNDGHAGATHPISGDAAGHNLNAPGHGLGPDGTLTTAPGGTFGAATLGCSSCHDPHGNTNFRLLYGAGQAIQATTFTFANAAPDAAGMPSLHSGNESNALHTAYKSGMSAWCANCHGDFHDNSTKLIHPSGEALGGTIAATYNAYNGTEDQTGGVQATAYLAAVAFEDPANTPTGTGGPLATSQISCITCHRAHATSAPDAGRWDFNVTLLEEDGVESGSDPIADPYNSPNQRSLCNKCHNKDAYDHIEITP